MTIVRAFYPEPLAEEQGWFVVESAGGIISDHISLTLDDNDKKNAKAPGIVGWLADPANTIETYQISLQKAKKNFRDALDASVNFTKSKISDRDGIYDGDDPDYFLEIWPEFFEFQKWYALPDPKPARPATPKLDFYAELLRGIVNNPGFTINNARGRLRAQLNNRRFKIMAEKIDASGNLEEYRLRQPAYLSMQKEAKQRRFSRINNNSSLTENEKADQIQALAETMIRPNGEPRPFNLDDDPANPVITL